MKKLILSAVVVLAAALCFACTEAPVTGGTGGATKTDPGATSNPTSEVTTTTEVTSTAEATETDDGLPPLDPPAPGTKKYAVITGGGTDDSILSRMVDLTGKENPKCVILTTAGKDSKASIQAAIAAIGPLTDNYEIITLCTQLYDPAELRNTIVTADMIYEVGGQSEFMDETWKKFHVDDYIRLAYERGVVVGGGSAGGMCWTYAAWNDFYELPESVYKWFYGLDIVPIYYGPHFDDNEEWREFHDAIMALENPKYNVGYAMDGGCAIVLVDGVVTEYLRDDQGGFVWEYTYADGEWTCRKIEEYANEGE